MALTQLQELRGKQDHLFDAYGKALKDAKTTDGSGDYNFDNLKEINGESVEGLTDVAKAEKLDTLNEQINDLQPEIDKLAKVEEMAERLKRRQINALPRNPEPGNDSEKEMTIGEAIINSKAYKAYLADGSKIKSYEDVRVKATFSRTAGYAPENLRSGRIQEMGVEPFTVLDLIPPGTETQSQHVWMAETTHTNAAAERAEAAAYAESTFEYTEQSVPLQTIGHLLPFSDEVISDTARMQSELDLRMRTGLRERWNTQLVAGNGTAPNIRGLRHVTGITDVTNKVAATTILDYVYTLRRNVRTAGKTNANAVLMRVANLEAVATAKTTDGIYLWGSPISGLPQRIWGMIPVETEDVEANHAAAVDTTYLQAFTKGGIEVQVGYRSNDFRDGLQTIRAGVRTCLVVYRATAIAYGGGLNT